MQQRNNFVNKVPMEFAPDFLAVKARDIAAGLGYTERPVDRAFGWFTDAGYRTYASAQPDAARCLTQQGTNRPPPLIFWYREAPRYLVGEEGGAVERNTPPPRRSREISKCSSIPRVACCSSALGRPRRQRQRSPPQTSPNC